jgi:integrase/recombinase XerD
MNFYSIDGITIASILDSRRANKDGNFPVKNRITHKRVRKYYSTGKNLSELEWKKLTLPGEEWKKFQESEEWKRLGKPKIRNLSDEEIAIINSFDKIKNAVISLVDRSEFSFALLNRNLGKSLSDSVNTAFKAKISHLEAEGSPGTQLFYQAALNSLQKFAGDNIAFSSVTVKWLDDYEKTMLKGGSSQTTISMYLRALRAICNEAKMDHIIKEEQYPFGKGKKEIRTGSGRKLALSLPQIKSIVFYTDGKETTEKYRDLWFFSYLCNGINFSDLVNLKYSDIRNGEISFVREKTKRTSKVQKVIQAIMTPEMQKIISRWGTKKTSENQFIFPYLKGTETPMEAKIKSLMLINKTNKALKAIGTSVGIDKLTTYVARHSYATVLKRSGANIAFISESLGHSDQKTTEHYLASFEQVERLKNAAFLTQF